MNKGIIMEEFISNLPFFKGFDRENLSRLIAESQEESYASGEVIVEFGQPGRFIGIMLNGRAQVVVDDPDKGRIRLGWLNQRDFFGEMALMTGEPASAYVIADEPCKVLLVPLEVFAAHLATDPDAVRLIAKTITEGIRSRDQDEDEQCRVKDSWTRHPDPYGLNLQTSRPIKLLVINCGSSSLKYKFFDTDNPENNARGLIERIGEQGTRHQYISEKGKLGLELEKGDHGSAFESMVNLLTDPEHGVIKDLGEICVVAHRVVHGGDRYHQAILVTEKILDEISELSHLAPLHNPVNVMGIKESMRVIPDTRQVAVFDTAFHHNMPTHARVYGLPFEYYHDHGIRRYGFHGTSHQYVALRAAEFLKKPFSDLKLITCHLGNGASICAIDHGQSVDTSMGMTPTEGLLMGTRSGDLDPAIILYIQRNIGLSAEETDDLLNRQSGLKGVSGISNDLREIESAAGKGDPRALLAKQLFCYRLKKYIGSYASAMGGLDALIFTGGIGEGSAGVRARACQDMDYMGILLHESKNRTAAPLSGEIKDISDEDSHVKVLIVPTDEERMIAREAIRTLAFRDLAESVMRNWDDMPIPIDVSGHHVHLCRADADMLFGSGYELTFQSWLSQPGQFVCNETVNLVGPKGRVEGVSIFGPLRKQSQVELSIIEGFKLGIDPPVRPSGQLDRTPGITMEGHAGKLIIPQGVIRPLSHIHMSPEDALLLGLRDSDMVRIRVEGKRSLILDDVMVRLNPDFKLNMHLDRDEANAAEIKTGMTAVIQAILDRR